MPIGKFIPREFSHDEITKIHDQIIQLLEEENCTVRQATSILSFVTRTISGTAPVQFVEGLAYEF